MKADLHGAEACTAELYPRRGLIACGRAPGHDGDHARTTVSGATWTWPQGVTHGEPVREGCRAMNWSGRILYRIGRLIELVGEAICNRAVRCQRVPKGGAA